MQNTESEFLKFQSVSWWLNKINADKILSKKLWQNYCAKYPIDYESIKNKKLTLQEIQKAHKKNFLAYLKRLCKIKPEIENCEEWFFFASLLWKDGEEKISTIYCKQNDILKKKNPKNYAYDFTEFRYILSAKIAPTDLTLRNIYEVLSEILFEASFFGYKQESLQKEKDKLLKSKKEVEEGKCETFSMEEVMRYCGMVVNEGEHKKDEFGLALPTTLSEYKAFKGKDEKSEELDQKIVKAEMNFSHYAFLREVGKVRLLLLLRTPA